MEGVGPGRPQMALGAEHSTCLNVKLTLKLESKISDEAIVTPRLVKFALERY